jgi:hypothetical protein
MKTRRLTDKMKYGAIEVISAQLVREPSVLNRRALDITEYGANFRCDANYNPAPASDARRK